MVYNTAGETDYEQRFRGDMNVDISVCIPAFNAADTIGRTLESIRNQTRLPDEVIIGVDGCLATLAALDKQVPESLRSITRVVWMEGKAGCYRTRNSITLMAGGDVIIPFDADDEMFPEHVETLMNHLVGSGGKPVQTMCVNRRPEEEDYTGCSNCSMAYTKDAFVSLGGYEPWICGADSEFIERIARVKGIAKTHTPTFVRHRLDTSLTGSPETGPGSPVRGKYQAEVRNRRENPVVPDSVATAPFKEVYLFRQEAAAPRKPTFRRKSSPTPRNRTSPRSWSVIIPAFNSVRFIEECLDSISHPELEEILVGCDGCIETFEKVKELDRPLVRAFLFDRLKTPYVIRNTLAEKAESEWLLFFDADDWLEKGGFSKVHEAAGGYEAVRSPFYEQEWDENHPSRERVVRNTGHAQGQFAIRRETFLKTKGFQPWQCAADNEYWKRNTGKINTNLIGDRVFTKRKHSEELTRKVETSQKSEIRNYYHSLISSSNPDPLIMHTAVPLEEA